MRDWPRTFVLLFASILGKSKSLLFGFALFSLEYPFRGASGLPYAIEGIEILLG